MNWCSVFQFAAVFLSVSFAMDDIFWPEEVGPAVPTGPPKICGSPSDIVFILDGSTSIYYKDFNKQLAFINTVINEFPFEDDGSMTRIGAIQFSTDNKIKIQFNLGNIFNKENLKEKIAEIKQLYGNTYTHLALKKARQEMFTLRAGARLNDKDIPKIAIILTDGVSEDRAKTAAEAKALRALGVRMLAIGIGNVDKREIRALASDDKSAFYVSSFDALNTIKVQLAVQACQVKTVTHPWTNCGTKQKTDVAIVLGCSTTRTRLEAKKAFWFIKKLTSKFEVGPDNIQVAVVPKECEAPGFHFKAYNTKQGIYKHMSNAKISFQTTEERMRYMTAQTFRRSNGARPGVRKLAVLIVRPGEDMQAVRRAAKKAKQRGVELAVIGVGVPRSQLRGLASPGKLMAIRNYRAMSLKMKKMIYSFICGEN